MANVVDGNLPISVILNSAVCCLQNELGAARKYAVADTGQVIIVTCLHYQISASMKELAMRILARGEPVSFADLPISGVHKSEGRVRLNESAIRMWADRSGDVLRFAVSVNYE